ncbi:N-acetyl-D-Glu racemase DgcA [Blastochloris sulfoviridis]|uniref:Dipeptide epimerase n=1 Tax=Blastochloris sulfoviridis TaxID=50712 RepID=A0A5M6HQL1_9HYPH|nr:N-acetyl-D-Glu racemase DgcA [Blastochloris sulfoviridis]KAA5598146.1 dipeptide epimerase [Blastochloris sulfoviridis]
MTAAPVRKLTVRAETFPLAGVFTISRGSRTEARVVAVEISQGALHGRGECVPYQRYGETVEGTIAAVEALAADVAGGLNRSRLTEHVRAGAARNAVDCALWDLEAKLAHRPAWALAGLPEPKPAVTAYTISLGTPEAMAAAARAASSRPLLKIKLGGDGDAERIRAVRTAAPRTRLIVDANEAWTPDMLEANLAGCAAAGVEMVEQPLPAGHDDALAAIRRPIPVCADESVHDRSTLGELAGRYDAINIKLDKTGGLTEAIELAKAARGLGLDLMIGCMVGSSLAMAPALLLAHGARWVDLDGPLLLAKDRAGGLHYEGSLVFPPQPVLWG